MANVKFKYGSEEQYNNIEPDKGTFYHITDENGNVEDYLGDILLGEIPVYQMPGPKSIFGNNTPDLIKQAVTEGTAQDLWSVGDTIAIELNGTVGELTFNNETYYAFILGFDHNKGLETNGKHSLTLGFGKTVDGTDIALIDSQYENSLVGNYFRMNNSNTNAGGWESSYMRNTICPAFYAALPSDWQKVIDTIIKYTNNAGNSSNTDAGIWNTDEQIFLLAEYEIFGSRTYANSYEQNYQQQYDYYAAGNSAVKYKHSDTDTTCTWWSRSATSSSDMAFCMVSNTGTISYNSFYSRGFAPTFCIVSSGSAIVTNLPYQDGTLYYTGGELTPTWANYNPDIMTISGETSATKVGTYTAVFTLANGYVWPNGTNTLEVTWKIDSAVVTDLPYQTGDLYYDGTELTPEWANYNADIMTIGGVTSAIEAGTYTATFTLADGYVWPDGGNTLDVEWTIEEASGEIPSGDIYIAFYSADDSSLNFCGLAMVPETGQIALGKTITTVYTDVTNTGTSTSSIPWYSDRTNFTTVIFDSSFAGAKPAQTAYWFYNFNSCTLITGLSYLDTSNVTYMNAMFYYCDSLITLDVSNFDTPNVTNMSYMFYNCSSLTTLDLSNFNTSNVTDMTDIFYNCRSLITLDVSNFDTSNVTNMSYMFNDCRNLTALNLSSFNTSKVTGMRSMFYYCSSLITLDVSNFDTSNVTNMSYMFYNCSSLTTLDLSNFDTSNVTNMTYIFYNCSSLTTLDVSKFDISNVTTMSFMFDYCSSLTTLDVSNFNTSKATTISYMFDYCSGLTTLDVSNFDTSNVTNMSYMFNHCSSLTTLDVSNFDTSNVTNISCMFYSCTGLTTIYSDDSKFVTTKVTNGNNMFYNCTKLVGGNGTVFDSSNISYTMAHIDTASNPGYFTAEYNDVFSENTPAQIQTAISQGIAADLWSVGDSIAINLNGTFSNGYGFNNETYYAFIIGFDHNNNLETNNKHSMTLQFGKMENGTDICFISGYHDDSYFYMNSTNTNVGGWESCLMRTQICPEFFNCLPFDWQKVIGIITKYTDNIGNSSDTAAGIWDTDEQIFLLAEYEIFGNGTYANMWEAQFQKQYDYYAAGNSKTKYSLDIDTNPKAVDFACSWWSRSACYKNDNYFCYVNTWNESDYTQAYHSVGFTPAFAITE